MKRNQEPIHQHDGWVFEFEPTEKQLKALKTNKTVFTGFWEFITLKKKKVTNRAYFAYYESSWSYEYDETTQNWWTPSSKGMTKALLSHMVGKN